LTTAFRLFVTDANIEKILERLFLAEEMHLYSELFFQDHCFAVRVFTTSPTRHCGWDCTVADSASRATLDR
jgi:hypothetical protein